MHDLSCKYLLTIQRYSPEISPCRKLSQTGNRNCAIQSYLIMALIDALWEGKICIKVQMVYSGLCQCNDLLVCVTLLGPDESSIQANQLIPRLTTLQLRSLMVLFNNDTNKSSIHYDERKQGIFIDQHLCSIIPDPSLRNKICLNLILPNRDSLRYSALIESSCLRWNLVPYPQDGILEVCCPTAIFCLKLEARFVCHPRGTSVISHLM